MRRILSVLLCCLLMCGFAFAEETTMESREYYPISFEDFESKSKGIRDSNYLVKTDGYAFLYDSFGNRMITFIFTITPLEKDMPFITLPVLVVEQGGEKLVYGEPAGSAYDFRNGIVNAMTKPWMTNGFSVPYTAIYDAHKDEEYHISFSYRLNNITDDVSVEFALTSLPKFTVSIPEDAFLI